MSLTSFTPIVLVVQMNSDIWTLLIFRFFSLFLSSAGKFVLINTIAVIMSIIIRGARHGSGHNLCQPDGKWGETLEDEFITLTITLDRKFSFANLKEKKSDFFFVGQDNMAET